MLFHASETNLISELCGRVTWTTGLLEVKLLRFTQLYILANHLHAWNIFRPRSIYFASHYTRHAEDLFWQVFHENKDLVLLYEFKVSWQQSGSTYPLTIFIPLTPTRSTKFSQGKVRAHLEFDKVVGERHWWCLPWHVIRSKTTWWIPQ